MKNFVTKLVQLQASAEHKLNIDLSVQSPDELMNFPRKSATLAHIKPSANLRSSLVNLISLKSVLSSSKIAAIFFLLQFWFLFSHEENSWKL